MLDRFRNNMSNEWFFGQPNTFLRYLLVFIQGDAIIVVPFFGIVLLFGFISIDFMLVLIGLYLLIRSIGEMMFWMLQQFGARTYRPYDFGFKNLDNHAIYILYQLIGMVGAVFGAAIIIMVLFF